MKKQLLARSSRLQAILNQSRESIKSGKGLSSSDFWKAVEQQDNKSED